MLECDEDHDGIFLCFRLWPDYVLAHNNLATLLEDRDSSIVHLRRALEIDPWHPTSLYNMAVLYR